MDKLILQDVPEEVDNDFLTLFVANCIKLPEDEFSVTRTQSWKKALVHFAKEYSLKGKFIISYTPVKGSSFAFYSVSCLIRVYVM